MLTAGCFARSAAEWGPPPRAAGQQLSGVQMGAVMCQLCGAQLCGAQLGAARCLGPPACRGMPSGRSMLPRPAGRCLARWVVPRPGTAALSLSLRRSRRRWCCCVPATPHCRHRCPVLPLSRLPVGEVWHAPPACPPAACRFPLPYHCRWHCFPHDGSCRPPSCIAAGGNASLQLFPASLPVLQFPTPPSRCCFLPPCGAAGGDGGAAGTHRPPAP